MDNAALSELLARASDAQEEPRKKKALRRAARAAYAWPVEAAALDDRTQLRAVGPWTARVIGELLHQGEPPNDTPPIRAGFMTLARARAVLDANPSARAAFRGDLQMHTTYSDGAAVVEDMVRAAKELGHDFVAITDHSKGLKIAGGIDERVLRRQAEEIAGVEAAVGGVRVLRSMEVNISPEGEVDMEPDALAELDVVLGAFHSALRRTDDQTERYLAALANPHVDTLAHPRGRIFNYRKGLTADWPRVFAAAAELGKAVEIDCYPDRQDLNVELARLAAEAGCVISVGTDAHDPDELAFIELGVAIALEAGVPFERILNCWSADQVVAWARASRARRGDATARAG